MYNINSHINLHFFQKLPGEAGKVPLVIYIRKNKELLEFVNVYLFAKNLYTYIIYKHIIWKILKHC